MIKKETAEYIAGQRNATRDEFILSREKAGRAEYVNVSLPDSSEPIYTLWTKPPGHKKAAKAPGEIVKTPKHTGGKRPYIILMQDQQDILNKLSMEASGLLLKLLGGGFIAWDTGQIIDRRSKQPLTIALIRARYKLETTKTKALIKELTENDIIKYDRSQRSYFLCPKFARKGAGNDAD